MKYRWFVVALALLAASAFALSVQAGQWWSIGDVSVGPFGSRSPFGGQSDLGWAGGSVRWVRLGMATWAAGLIAMFVLVVLGGGVAARRVPKLAARTSLVAIGTATLAGIGFIAARPENGMAFSPDRGMLLFVAAVVVGLVAALRVLRAPVPVKATPAD